MKTIARCLFICSLVMSHAHAVVMGNLAGVASLPLLEAMSKDSEGQTREYCRVAIAKIRYRSSH